MDSNVEGLATVTAPRGPVPESIINAFFLFIVNFALAGHRPKWQTRETRLSQRLQLHAALACTWLQTENLMKADSTPWNWKLVSTLQ